MKTKFKDVLNAEEYFFSNEIGDIEEGDSGELLIATNKDNIRKKYLVKHYHVDCACNEYVSSKLAKAVNANYPECKLFDLSECKDSEHFKTEYVVGIEWLDELKCYAPEKDIVTNPEDYYKYMCLAALFGDFDGFEAMCSNGKLYKIDNACGFGASLFTLANISRKKVMPAIRSIMAGQDEELIYEKLLGEIKEESLRIVENSIASLPRQLKLELELVGKNGGTKGEEIYKQTLYDFTQIQQDYIDEILDNLTAIYPEFMREHYQKYIDGAKHACIIFILKQERQ